MVYLRNLITIRRLSLLGVYISGARLYFSWSFEYFFNDNWVYSYISGFSFFSTGIN